MDFLSDFPILEIANLLFYEISSYHTKYLPKYIYVKKKKLLKTFFKNDQVLYR